MAKMKISELATEINVDKNEIVAFLNNNGFECKSATKTIEDEQINAVKAKFAPPKAEPKPAAPAQSAAKPAAPAQPAAKPQGSNSAPAEGMKKRPEGIVRRSRTLRIHTQQI